MGTTMPRPWTVTSYLGTVHRLTMKSKERPEASTAQPGRTRSAAKAARHHRPFTSRLLDCDGSTPEAENTACRNRLQFFAARAAGRVEATRRAAVAASNAYPCRQQGRGDFALRPPFPIVKTRATHEARLPSSPATHVPCPRSAEGLYPHDGLRDPAEQILDQRRENCRYQEALSQNGLERRVCRSGL
jgi:hypothetical protein